MPNSTKRLLFIQYTPDFQTTQQTIKHICDVANIEMVSHQISNVDDLVYLFQTENSGYDYLFLGAHGCVKGFAGDTTGANFVRWADFGLVVCRSQALANNSVMYLGCCKGGMKNVAQVLMYNCNQINFVAGPACNVFGQEIGLAFHTFIISSLQRNSSKHLSERVTVAIGQEFNAFDRSDIQADLHTLKIAGHVNALDEVFIATNDIAPYISLPTGAENIERPEVSTH